MEQIQQGNISYNDTKDVLKKLVNETENSLTQGDVKAVVDIMDALANIASQKHPPDEEYLGVGVHFICWKLLVEFRKVVLFSAEALCFLAVTYVSLFFP